MKEMHWMSILGLIFITLGGILSFFGTQLSDKKSQDDLTNKIQDKNNKIENINDKNTKLIEQNSDLLTTTNEVSISNKELINQSNDLLLKIGNYQLEVDKKNKMIKELEEKVNKVSKGIVNYIHWNGVQRIMKAGELITLHNTEHNNAFIKMTKLSKENKYEEVIKLCDKYIPNEVEWQTPYIIKAIALLNLNRVSNKDEVLDLLDYSSKKITGDIDYGLEIMNILLNLNEKERLVKVLENFSINDINSVKDGMLKNKLLELKKL